MGDTTTELTLVVTAAQPLMGDLLANALDSQDGTRVVGRATSAAEAGELVNQLQPRAGLFVLDGVPSGEVAQAVRSLKEAAPSCGAVVLTDAFDARAAEALTALSARGWGYLPLTAIEDVNSLAGALRAAADGLVIMDRHAATVPTVRQLTQRQQEVLALMAQGYNNAAIARRLVLEEKSVENHINAIFNQLGVNHDGDGHPRVRAVLDYFSLARPDAGPAAGTRRAAFGVA